MNIVIGSLSFNFAWQLLLFLVEIFSAELLFLHPFERKRGFALRYTAVVVICCFYRIVYANLDGYIAGFLQGLFGEVLGSSFDNFFLYVSVLIMTIVGMRFCFKGTASMIISACSAGYAVQHSAFKFYNIVCVVLQLEEWVSDYAIKWLLAESLCHLVTYVLGYYIFVRPAKKYDFKTKSDPILNLLSVIIVAIGIGINRFAVDFSVRTDMQIISDSLYAITCCVFALIIQFSLFERNLTRMEMELYRTTLKEQGKQYEQWKANFENTNMKFHDLRHELNVLKEAAKSAAASEQFHKFEHLIENSFSVLHTGSEMLDVLLMQKKQLCNKSKIIFTCTADGQALGDVNSMELFSIFCNALDNAIESVSRISQEEKRVINLNVKRMGAFVDIHLQNYFEGPIHFQDGLPVSEKEDAGHGYGMKSMKRTVEELGGAMSVYAEEDLFHLQFVIPT